MDTLHEDRYIFMIILHSFLLRLRNVSGKSRREIQNTIWYSITFSRKSCRLCSNVEIIV
jgi:hypothetical protein